MRVWKLLGIAGLTGVATTGAVLVRHERHRRSYSAEDVRARLHLRAESATQLSPDPDLAPDWPPDVEPPQRHPLEQALDRVMQIGPLRRLPMPVGEARRR
jgi:hypothetical protein